MATSLHNPYPRSPNPSTRSFDSSSVSSAASPRLPALHGRFFTNGLANTSTGARSDPAAVASAAAAEAAAPQPVGILPPSLPSLHEYGKQHQQPLYQHSTSHHQHHHVQHHVHNHQHRQQHHQHNYQPYPPVTAGSAMGGRGDSLPPTDSLASTPGPGYIALPPLHHAGGPGAAYGSGGGGGAAGAAGASSSSSSVPMGATHPSMSSTNPASLAAAAAAAAAAQQHQQQQQQLQHQNAQKRAYRQRRKDPSCDACRERKVKCDATETTSCSECSNRQVKCQFTKETNRRMSSIKQMQDLERQLDRMRRENSGLRRILQERGPASSGSSAAEPQPGRGGGQGGPLERMRPLELDTDSLAHPEPHHLPLLPIPDIGSNPPRRHRRATRQGPGAAPLLDFGRARSNLRIFAKGIWAPPAPFDQQATSPIAPARQQYQSEHEESTGPQLPDLPPRAAVDVLLRSYYASVHAMLPMIHWPTFQRQVEHLYAAADAMHAASTDANRLALSPRSRPPVSPAPPPTSFTALFFAVLAVGGLFCTYFVDNPSPPFTAVHLAEASRALIDPWTMGGSNSGGGGGAHVLDDARTLLLLAVFLSEINLKTAAWAWLGSAVRVAQALGLYMEPEPSVAQGGFGPLEAEMRRRVWWAIYVLDRTLAVELGNRPVLINDDDCDVALPAVVDDHYLVDDAPGGVANIPADAEPLTQSLVAVLHVVRAYTALGKLLSAASSLPPPSSSLFSSSLSASLPPSGGRPLSSSSPLSTPSPSSSFAALVHSNPTTTPTTTTTTTAATAGTATAATPSGVSIPATHLATFDQHFAACLRVFPPSCDPSHHQNDQGGGGGPVLPAHLLSPLVYLLHARLVLHRHNLAPHGMRTQQPQQQAPSLGAAPAAAPAATSMAMQARLSAVDQCTHTALETAALVRRARLDELASGAGATALLATHLMRCALFLLLGGHVDAAAALVRALAAVAVVRREVATPCGRYLAFFTSCLAFKRAEYAAYLARTTPAAAAAQNAQHHPQHLPQHHHQQPSPPSHQLHDALVRDEELLVYVSADLQSSPESAWVWDGDVAAAASPPSMSSTTAVADNTITVLAHMETRMGLSDEESRDWGGWDRLQSRVCSLASAPSTPTTTIAGAGAGAGAAPPPPTSYSTTTAGTTSPVAHYTHQPPLTAEQQQRHPYQQQQQQQQPHPQAHAYPPYDLAGAGGSSSETPAGAPRVDSPVGGSGSKSKSQERISIANII